MKMRVLFVDDEPFLLEGLRRAFRPFRATWEVAFAGGGEDALRTLETGEFDAIVSDLSMPGMDGATLLTAVRDLRPDMLRILMSGHWDPESEVTSEWAHMSFAKPCPIDDLRAALTRPVEFGEKMGDPELSQGIRSLASGLTACQMCNDLEAIPPAASLPLSAKWTRLLGQTVVALHEALPGREQELHCFATGAHNCGPGAERLLALVTRELARDRDGERVRRYYALMIERAEQERAEARARRPDSVALQQEAAIAGFLKETAGLVLSAGGCREDSVGAPWAIAYLGALWGVPGRVLAALQPKG